MTPFRRRRIRTGSAHGAFNEAMAHVDMLKRLIANREASAWPCGHLLGLLREAEIARDSARDELLRVGVTKF
jgi:hypothetical protein